MRSYRRLGFRSSRNERNRRNGLLSVGCGAQGLPAPWFRVLLWERGRVTTTWCSGTGALPCPTKSSCSILVENSQKISFPGNETFARGRQHRRINPHIAKTGFAPADTHFKSDPPHALLARHRRFRAESPAHRR